MNAELIDLENSLFIIGYYRGSNVELLLPISIESLCFPSGSLIGSGMTDTDGTSNSSLVASLTSCLKSALGFFLVQSVDGGTLEANLLRLFLLIFRFQRLLENWFCAGGSGLPSTKVEASFTESKSVDTAFEAFGSTEGVDEGVGVFSLDCV